MNIPSDLLGLMCAGAAAGLFALFLFGVWRAGKRAAWRRFTRRSPRCARCGYNMRGLHTLQCPECGVTYTVEQLWLAQRDLLDDSVSDE